MAILKFSVDAEKCTKCDTCVKTCLGEVIKRKGALPEITEQAGKDCFECQQCLAVCPSGAISIFDLKPENSLSLTDIPSYQQMKTFVRGRRSVRCYCDEDVSTVLIDELLADLAHAPTGGNTRDLVFSVVYSRETMKTLRERIMKAMESQRESAANEFFSQVIAEYRKNGKDILFRGAPHLLIVSPGAKAICGQEDSVLALAYFEFLAQSAGIGTTWCGILKFFADTVPEIYDLIGLAPGSYFYAMMFGKPAIPYARTVQRDTMATFRRIDVV